MKSKSWCFGNKVSENKAWEIQFGWWDEWTPFDFRLRWNRKCDHAGLHFGIDILWFHLYLDFYDVRHWDIDNNKWEVHNA